MIKRRISCLLMPALPLSAVLLLWYRLETYTQVVHNESATLVQLYSLICTFVSVLIWRKNRRNGRRFTIMLILSLLVLAGTYYIGGRIPFCVECDQVTAEELGFLTRWIPPCG